MGTGGVRVVSGAVGASHTGVVRVVRASEASGAVSVVAAGEARSSVSSVGAVLASTDAASASSVAGSANAVAVNAGVRRVGSVGRVRTGRVAVSLVLVEDVVDLSLDLVHSSSHVVS